LTAAAVSAKKQLKKVEPAFAGSDQIPATLEGECQWQASMNKF
jgi:hypothetical protein